MTQTHDEGGAGGKTPARRLLKHPAFTSATSLNVKVMRLVGAVKIALLASYCAIFSFVIWPAFDSLQHDEAARNLERVLEAVANEEEDLGRQTRDFSAWDATYAYVRKPNPDYDHQTFTVDVMRDLEMQLIVIYDEKGRYVKGMAIDLASGKEISFDLFKADLPKDHPLLAHGKLNGTTGILNTRHGPLMLASFPILQSSREGPARGSFMFGRLLNAQLMKKLVGQTHVTFEVFRTDREQLATSERAALAQLLEGEKHTFDEAGGSELATYSLVPALLNGKSLLVKAQTPMNISDIGFTTLAIAAISTIVMSFLGIAIFWWSLKQLIVGPINQLTNHVVAVGRTGDLSQRMAFDRSDEIGVLSKEFNSAVEQLENVRRRLLEKSYQSGMAEIAAGVIHNVRNALSPIVVTVAHLSDVATTPPVAHLDDAFKELKSTATKAERRQMLVEYVEAAMQTMTERGRRFADDLKSVAEQNRHIEQILHDHTALSMGTRRLEPVSLASVVEEAARFIPSQESTVVELRVSPAIAALPPVTGHQIVVTQILGNLMVNAAEAIREAGHGKGAIEIDATLDEENGRPAVHLKVTDNGKGIAPEVLPNLFGRGFSTKKGKTGGIGLHWSANSIAAMGGHMSVESEGLGHGATFHVILPVAANAEEMAA